jgi:hypothetical protein
LKECKNLITIWIGTDYFWPLRIMKHIINPLAFVIFLTCISAAGCSALQGDTRNSVRPVIHKGYYKKHLYKKHLAIGRFRINWFEKQGVKQTRR